MTKLPPTPERTEEQEKISIAFRHRIHHTVSTYINVKSSECKDAHVNQQAEKELKESLIPLKNIHQSDLTSTVLDTWGQARNTDAEEIVYDAIKSAVLKMAALPLTETKGERLEPWSSIDDIRIRADDDSLDHLAAEAFAVAYENIAKVIPSTAMRIVTGLLHIIPKNSPHREKIKEAAQDIIKNRGSIPQLITDKAYLFGPLDEKAKQAIKEKFNTLTAGQTTELILKAANTPHTMKELSSIIGQDSLINTARTGTYSDAILSLIFDERVYQSIIQNTSPEQKTALIKSMDWKDYIPNTEETAPTTQ